MEVKPYQKRTLEYYNKNIGRSERFLNSKWSHPWAIALFAVVCGTAAYMLIDVLMKEFSWEEFLQWKTVVRSLFSFTFWYFLSKWMLKGNRKNLEEMKVQRAKLEEKISINS